MLLEQMTFRTKLSLSEPKKAEGPAKFREWKDKWNRLLSTVFSVLGFLLLFAVVIANIATSPKQAHNCTKAPTATTTQSSVTEDNDLVDMRLLDSCDTTVSTSTCEISVSRCESGTISDNVDNALGEFCSEIAHLTIRNCIFSRKTVSGKWYQSEIPIKKLLITGTSDEIEPKALDIAAFHSIEILELGHFNLTVLRKGVFSGLINVKHLVLTNCELQQIEEHVLSDLTSLESFAVSDNKPVFRFDNLTATDNLTRLNNLDLRYNNLPNVIDKKSFQQVYSNAETKIQIYLASSNIEVIGDGAFDSSKIVKLILSKNSIKTIKPSLFDAFSTSVDLGDNPWDCQCDLLQFQQALINNPSKYSGGPFTCQSPADLKGIAIVEADLCSDRVTDSSATTSQGIIHSSKTESTTSESPDTNNSDLTNLHCLDYTSETNHTVIEIEVRTTLMVTDVSAGSVLVTLTNIPTQDVALIWFSALQHVTSENTEKFTIRCNVDLSTETVIDNLVVGHAYTFCLVAIAGYETFPFNCTSHYIPSEDDSTILWLEQSDKTLVISMVALVFFITWFCGGFCVYIFHRKKAFKNRNFPQMPNQPAANIYMDPAPTGFAPNAVGLKIRRPTIIRRNSDASTVCSSRTYVTANAPVHNQLMTNPAAPLRNSLLDEAIYEELRSLSPIPERRQQAGRTSRIPSISSDVEKDDDYYLNVK